MADKFQPFQEETDHGDQNLDFNISMDDNSQQAKKSIDSDAKIQQQQQLQKQKQTITIPAESLPDYSKTVRVGETSYLSQASHPKMCILQLLFKASSITTLLLTSFVFDFFDTNKTFPFVIIVLSAAFDFWVVKNLTGRFLVKLRWWSEINEDGTEQWRFESYEDGVPPNAIDSGFFWFSQTGALVFWILCCIINLLAISPFYFTLSMINTILVGGNFTGYYKCKGAHQKKMKNAVSKLGLKIISDAF
ncbi:FAM18-like protein (macronuclear) [Tetrahymena thermophila SB210]|uniref:Golgi apparatus membrane protein TVP23 homolog n=1 Tax=Tetrahymena thermophila (strain SB210) TaxID=312017 RepID=Q23PZ7_TETTS|nr:FAM18-like protein [Tetrahymena thermophila SB210]EAR98538.2 FAM18-like protein [Tetrahymena thermophila SB210]|eukprot:XP_001018783.2 FAM18-like protein [Tetrahymena thermophila SB210]